MEHLYLLAIVWCWSVTNLVLSNLRLTLNHIHFSFQTCTLVVLNCRVVYWCCGHFLEKVERLVASCGHQAIFIPKFHCELNPIESCWCHSKHYTRSHCDHTFPGLLAIIDQSLNSMTLDMIQKFFQKTRETMQAYREGLTPELEMTKALKTYKSHWRISEPQ